MNEFDAPNPLVESVHKEVKSEILQPSLESDNFKLSPRSCIFPQPTKFFSVVISIVFD
jgi:hypothetical protein